MRIFLVVFSVFGVSACVFSLLYFTIILVTITRVKKRLPIIPLIVGFIILLVCLFSVIFVVVKGNSNQKNDSPSPLKVGQTIEVVLTSEGFSPAEVTLKAGDQIQFKTTTGKAFWPASDLHPTHGIYPEFDPQTGIRSDEVWHFQFLKSGRWKYHDHLSPQFKGVIVVE